MHEFTCSWVSYRARYFFAVFLFLSFNEARVCVFHMMSTYLIHSTFRWNPFNIQLNISAVVRIIAKGTRRKYSFHWRIPEKKKIFRLAAWHGMCVSVFILLCALCLCSLHLPRIFILCLFDFFRIRFGRRSHSLESYAILMPLHTPLTFTSFAKATFPLFHSIPLSHTHHQQQKHTQTVLKLVGDEIPAGWCSFQCCCFYCCYDFHFSVCHVKDDDDGDA